MQSPTRNPTLGALLTTACRSMTTTPLCGDFFSRLNTPLTNLSFASFVSPVYADFEEGMFLNLTAGTLGQDYIDELNKYPYLDNGFEIPDPVPEDLLLPWVEYIDKYNLDLSTAMATHGRPAVTGHLLNILAIYVFNNLNHLFLHEMSGATVVNANRDNSQLYRNAMSELQPDLPRSRVVAGQRKTRKRDGVRLVDTPTGRKLIIAKQLIVGIPPILDNMRHFGLNSHEHSILSHIYGCFQSFLG
ncbi:uncharacterized protein BDW70DRAFT_165109 [Aspergillus foveolatus]|uniref:uncharacterized protein n=1 Tax=Aspergillus foveolatus TaxID=210207 RepID=UPI003CCD95F8